MKPRAAERERSAARGNTVSSNVLKGHDSGNSPETNADACLGPPNGRSRVD